jgi:hypothetical protein
MFILAGIGAWWGAQHVQEQADTMNGFAWTIGFSMIAQIPILILYGYFRRKCGSRHILPVFLVAYIVFVQLHSQLLALGMTYWFKWV